MAATFAFTPSRRAVSPAGVRLFQRIVNALVEQRARSAELELRRHQALIEDLAGARGSLQRIGLDADDLLPFARAD